MANILKKSSLSWCNHRRRAPRSRPAYLSMLPLSINHRRRTPSSYVWAHDTTFEGEAPPVFLDDDDDDDADDGGSGLFVAPAFTLYARGTSASSSTTLDSCVVRASPVGRAAAAAGGSDDGGTDDGRRRATADDGGDDESASGRTVYSEADLIVRNTVLERGAAGLKLSNNATVLGCADLETNGDLACAAAYCHDAAATVAVSDDGDDNAGDAAALPLHAVGISCYCETYYGVFDPTWDGCVEPPLIDVPTRRAVSATDKPDQLTLTFYFVNGGTEDLVWSVALDSDPGGVGASWQVGRSVELPSCRSISFAEGRSVAW